MSKKKTRRIIIMSDIHYCKQGFYGVTQEIKKDRICQDLQKEYEDKPYEALLLLGDYSLDHWAWNTKGTYLTQGISEAKIFKEQCLESLAPKGVRVRMIAGNHEQYGERMWKRLTGFKRRDHIVCGPILFILSDTFGGDLDPTEHSDGTYIGANMSDITELMERYPDKKVILCAHWFALDKESEEFRSLIAQDERILCLMCGHNHISKVASTGETLGNKPIIYTGNYSYSGEANPLRCLSGYRELIIEADKLTSKYIVPSHTYTIAGITFTNEYAEQDKIEIKL